MKTTAGLGEVDALAIQKKEGRLDEEGVESTARERILESAGGHASVGT